MKKQNIVFFLGAGFSYEADMPTMDDFAKYSKKEYFFTTKHAFARSTSFRYAAPLIYDAGLIYNAFWNYCRDNNPLEPIKNLNNLEWLFQQAEENVPEEIQLHFDVIDFQYTCPFSIKKEELIIALQFWAWKIYNRLPIIGEKKVIPFFNEVNRKTYKDFSILLNNHHEENSIATITTNYDIIFEYILWKYGNGIKAFYPLDYNKIPIEDNWDNFVSISKTDIPLYKIHGSVNFYSKYSKKREVYISTDIAETNIGMSLIPNEPVTIHYDGLLALRYKYGSDMVPEIVPPSKKVYGNNNNSNNEVPKWQRQLLKGAQKKLNTADKVIFIGYSLPETDEDIKEWLRENTNPNAEILVIDPDDCNMVEKNYKIIYGENVYLKKVKFSDSLKIIEDFILK